MYVYTNKSKYATSFQNVAATILVIAHGNKHVTPNMDQKRKKSAHYAQE